MLKSLLVMLQAFSRKKIPKQKFSCRFFQIFKDHVSLQNNSGTQNNTASADPILRFKIQIVLKSKLTIEKCVFASVSLFFCFFFQLIPKEGELYEYKSNSKILFHYYTHLETVISSLGALGIF